MSRKKHNIAYIKPQEPKFIRELKAQAGYKEAPTIDTKSARNEDLSEDEDLEFELDERPVVVVLDEGDLTAEEANAIQKKKDEEEANAAADLSKKIIFNRKKKLSNDADDRNKKKYLKSSKESKPKIILSFNEDEDE